MKNIDIMLAVKAEDIMADYGKLSKDLNKPVLIHPSLLYRNYIRVLPDDDKVVSVDDELNLTIKADVGDLIRWSVTTLDIGSQYSASVVNIEPMRMVRMDDLSPLISPPVVNDVMKFVPTVDMRNITNVDVQSIKDYFWVAKVNDLPTVDKMRIMYYTCVVGIYREMKLLGYIAMEPGIVLDTRIIL
ncbi:inclusion body protein [Xenorhabdus sp. 12]|uniref:Inclusion body protein n=1 Tax=Xenorhabdus santafensis TaxID=2582833 RepID=A0ABU4SA14_9GAMM|nr:AidA/PixA family protein [Xenorhabdus sp. 12]MDX7987652.1 inclusion body protein [Xenorhabdus sp. 12]